MHPTFNEVMTEVVQDGGCCTGGSCVVVLPHDVIDDIAGKPAQVARARAAFDCGGMRKGSGRDVYAQVWPCRGERESMRVARTQGRRVPPPGHADAFVRRTAFASPR